MVERQLLEGALHNALREDEFVVELEVRPDRARVVIDSLVGVSIDDCVRVHQHLTSLKSTSWDGGVEVSSPGVGSFLVHPRQWETAVGRDIMLWTTDGCQLTGRLLAYAPRQQMIFLVRKAKNHRQSSALSLSIQQISKAKTVLA